MEYLRDGIHLRAMAQKDPLVEYRTEGHAMFEELGETIREEVVRYLFHVELAARARPQQLAPAAGPRQTRSSTSTSRSRAPTPSPLRAGTGRRRRRAAG